jgi:hypothetical protein
MREAFEHAAKALYAWDSFAGDEPTVIVDGSPVPISMVATQDLQGYDASRFVLAHGPSR